MAPTAVAQADLVVPANSEMTLSVSDSKSAVKPQTLTTTSLSELKSWIGLPDTLYSAGKLDRAKVVMPKVAASALTAEATAAIRTAAAAYLFGESSSVSAYQSAIEKYFKNFQIIFWPFYTITVGANSTLTMGPGQNVLSAWKIVLEKGAKVKAAQGALKVDSVILQVA
ncbi:MAG TPA: hypothetical protein VMD91_02465 [Candidatus Sulfotelmatobacter sp.]|nr:hypothetical protein [Candidatus Sulfotelmatobacter sp.]